MLHEAPKTVYLPLWHMAHRLGVSEKWLKAKALRGEVPYLKVGRSMKFDHEVIVRVLRTEAAKTCIAPGV